MFRQSSEYKTKAIKSTHSILRIMYKKRPTLAGNPRNENVLFMGTTIRFRFRQKRNNQLNLYGLVIKSVYLHDEITW